MPGKGSIQLEANVTGVEQASAALEDIRASALSILEEAMNQGGSVINEEATTNVERISPGQYGSGRGRENINHEVTKLELDEVRVDIGANDEAFYLNFHELGYTHPQTGKRIQNPWLRTALDSEEDNARKRIQEVLDAAMASAAAKHPMVQYLS